MILFKTQVVILSGLATIDVPRPDTPQFSGLTPNQGSEPLNIPHLQQDQALTSKMSTSFQLQHKCINTAVTITPTFM